MGFLDDLFGDEGERDRMLRKQLREYRTSMGEYLGQYEDLMNDALSFLGSQRDSDISAFTELYQSTISDYQSAFEMSRMGLLESFAEQRQFVEQGFDASREQLRLGTERQLASTRAANAFTGLGNTSFGQSTLNAVTEQGALQQGLLSERENQMMSDLVGAQGAALFNADQSAAQALMGAGQNFAAGLSAMNQSYTGMQFQGMSNMASNLFNAQSTFASNLLSGGQAQVANVGSGFNLGGALLGAGIGVLSDYASSSLTGSGDGQ